MYGPGEEFSQQVRWSGKGPKGHEAVKCSRCDGNHNPSECRFKEAKCHACVKIGHISRACISKEQRKQKSRRQPRRSWQQKPSLKNISGEENSSSGSEQSNDEYRMFTFGSICSAPYKVSMTINGTSWIWRLIPVHPCQC